MSRNKSIKNKNLSNKFQTKILQINTDNKSQDLASQLQEAVNFLKQGEIIVFPTETVYGLGANAFNPQAVAKIFQTKKRPPDNPIIVHISSENQLRQLIYDNYLSNIAKKLIDCFWPGPLTLIFKKSNKVPLITSGGLMTLAVRMPANKIALKLIETANFPIAAPSANLSERPSPTRIIDVVEDLFGSIPLIIDGGKSLFGLESTVLDITTSKPVILRPGPITENNITNCLSSIIDNPIPRSVVHYEVRSPGIKYRHYAPKAQVYILEGKYSLLNALIQSLNLKHTIGLILSVKLKKWLMNQNADLSYVKHISSFTTKEDLGYILFSELRNHDRIGVKIIFIERVSIKGIGEAIMNRALKASGSNVFTKNTKLK